MVRCLFDASLIARFGLATPVGLVRTEHYLVEHFRADPDIDLRFLIFDLDRHTYRTLRPKERIPDTLLTPPKQPTARPAHWRDRLRPWHTRPVPAPRLNPSARTPSSPATSSLSPATSGTT